MMRNNRNTKMIQPQKETYQVFPVTAGKSFFQPNNPFAATDIGSVLPYWPHSLLEQMVVTDIG